MSFQFYFLKEEHLEIALTIPTSQVAELSSGKGRIAQTAWSCIIMPGDVCHCLDSLSPEPAYLNISLISFYLLHMETHVTLFEYPMVWNYERYQSSPKLRKWGDFPLPQMTLLLQYLGLCCSMVRLRTKLSCPRDTKPGALPRTPPLQVYWVVCSLSRTEAQGASLAASGTEWLYAKSLVRLDPGLNTGTITSPSSCVTLGKFLHRRFNFFFVVVCLFICFQTGTHINTGWPRM